MGEPKTEAFDEVCRFIIRLGETAHGYGPNAYRLETYLARLTEAFGYHGVFRSTPTEIHFAFSENGEPWQQMHISSMSGTGLELNRLALLGELVDDLESGKLSLAEASARLDEVDKTPHPWGDIATAISYVWAGAGFTVLLGGGWWDVGLASLFSLVVSLMVLNAGRFGPLTGEWLPLTTAFVAGVLTAIARCFLPDINGVLVILSAVLILVPGYGITVGVVELVSQHVLSGFSNLITGLIYLFKQVVGAYLGVKAVGLLVSFPAATQAVAVDPQWLWLFMPLLIASLGVAFQTSIRDFLWAFLCMALAYGGILLGSHWAGANLGNFLGTVLTVLFANLWARETGRPTSIVLLPAFVLLVSGSIGFRGLAALSGGDLHTGQEQIMQMFIVGFTLAAGLFVGNTIIRPLRTL